MPSSPAHAATVIRWEDPPATRWTAGHSDTMYRDAAIRRAWIFLHRQHPVANLNPPTELQAPRDPWKAVADDD